MTINCLVRIGRNVLVAAWLTAELASAETIPERRLDSTSSFSIPPQALPSALLRYTEQSGVQVTSAADLVESKHSRGVIGKLEASTALQKILQGTELSFEMIDDSTVVIVRARTMLDPGPHERRALQAKRRDPIKSDENEVVVTGTHIRGMPSPASQVYSYDRAAIAASGATSVQEFLRTNPLNFAGGRTEASGALMSHRNGGRDNYTQGAGINIRGLGNESTLILVNGRRIASAGYYHDVSTIPLSAIERIQVLPDGSSAIYGSDAIAGVVNIILLDEFDGAETSVRYGGVTSGSLRELTVNQLIGRSWDQGSSLLVNFDYDDRGELPARERPYASDLWGGANDLLPSQERVGALLHGQWTISDSLRASLDAYMNRRNAHSSHFQSRASNQLEATSELEQLGGTAEIRYSLGRDWEVAIAHTYSNAEGSRFNDLGNVQAASSKVFIDSTVSTSELKASGTAFEAPGGTSRLAIGAERREELMGLIRRNFVGAPDTDSSIYRNVDAAYAELHVPLFSNTADDRRDQRLDLSAAVRYEDYSDVGSTETVKFGAAWSPAQSINLYTSWGTSFRAPYLQQYDSDLGAGIIIAVPNATAPTGTTLIAIAAQAPHPDLGPETATTWTTGFSFGQQESQALKVAAAYFHIDYRNRIVAPALTMTPFGDPTQAPLISLPADPEVLEFVRTAPLLANPMGRSIDAVEATLDGRIRNQAKARASGLDLTISKEFQARNGTFSADVIATYFLSFDTWTNSDSPPIQILDTVFNPIDLRARGQLSWSNQRWSLSTAVNYTDAYTDNQLSTPLSVSSWTTIDLSVSYAFPQAVGLLRDLRLRASVINALDEAPPRIVDRGGAYGDAGYDVENANALGRFVSVQFTKPW